VSDGSSARTGWLGGPRRDRDHLVIEVLSYHAGP
jgi:hypothetical protein